MPLEGRKASQAALACHSVHALFVRRGRHVGSPPTPHGSYYQPPRRERVRSKCLRYVGAPASVPGASPHRVHILELDVRLGGHRPLLVGNRGRHIRCLPAAHDRGARTATRVSGLFKIRRMTKTDGAGQLLLFVRERELSPLNPRAVGQTHRPSTARPIRRRRCQKRRPTHSRWLEPGA